MTMPAAGNVNTSTAGGLAEREYRPVRITALPDAKHPGQTNQTTQSNQSNQTQRTKSRRRSYNIYDLSYEAFVEHLRTIYTDTEVDMMISGVKLIDASGISPTIPWPEQQHQTQPTAATAHTTQKHKYDFSDDLDPDDLDVEETNDGDADPDLASIL